MHFLESFMPNAFMFLNFFFYGELRDAASYPPAPLDPRMVQVASDDTVLFVTWAGRQEPKEDSDNATEQLLSDPAVELLLENFAKFVRVEMFNSVPLELAAGSTAPVPVTTDQARSKEEQDLLEEKKKLERWRTLGPSLLTMPTSVVVDRFEFDPWGIVGPRTEWGLVIKLGDSTDEFRPLLSESLKMLEKQHIRVHSSSSVPSERVFHAEPVSPYYINSAIAPSEPQPVYESRPAVVVSGPTVATPLPMKTIEPSDSPSESRPSSQEELRPEKIEQPGLEPDAPVGVPLVPRQVRKEPTTGGPVPTTFDPYASGPRSTTGAIAELGPESPNVPAKRTTEPKEMAPPSLPADEPRRTFQPIRFDGAELFELRAETGEVYTVGIVEDCFIYAVGERVRKQLIAGIQGRRTAPRWYAEANDRITVPRMANMTYANVEQLIAQYRSDQIDYVREVKKTRTALLTSRAVDTENRVATEPSDRPQTLASPAVSGPYPSIPPPTYGPSSYGYSYGPAPPESSFDVDSFDRSLVSVGIDNLKSITNISGLDDRGMVGRTFFHFEGPLRGLAAVLPEKPLTKEDLERIPLRSSFAVAGRLDYQQLSTSAQDFIKLFAGEEALSDLTVLVNKTMDKLEAELDIDLVDDLLTPIGDSWTFFSIDEELIVKSLSVRDPQKLRATMRRLMKASEKKGKYYEDFELAGFRCWRDVESRESFCITDDALISGDTPLDIKEYLLAAQDSKSLAEHPAISALLASPHPPQVLVVTDSVRDFRRTYAALRKRIPWYIEQMGLPGATELLANLPRSAAIARHLEPQIFSLSRTPDGIISETHCTMPLGTMQLAAVFLGMIHPEPEEKEKGADSSVLSPWGAWSDLPISLESVLPVD